MKFKEYLKEFETHYDSKNGRSAWEKAEEKHFEKHGKSKKSKGYKIAKNKYKEGR